MTGSALQMPSQQIVSRAGWRGDDGMPASEFVYRLSDAELDELEREGARLVAADPDLSTLDVVARPGQLSIQPGPRRFSSAPVGGGGASSR